MRLRCLRSELLSVVLATAGLALVAAVAGATPQSPAAPSTAAAAPTIPGTLREAAKVDANGAFNFSIPIPVPPGIQGMQPDLTLAYSSQQSNGVLGTGWSLAGLPAIERAKRTRATDGINGTIAYDQNDRLALQGRRLIVTSGQYLAAGSTYHTEVESWQLVTANGQAGSGPQSFTVQTKDGKTLQLGGTADSGAAAAGRSDIRQWGVSSVTDLNGNTMTVSYSGDPLNTGTSDYQLYPVEIAYTSNGAQQANRFVKFVYAARPDVQRTFVGGSQVTLSVLLTHVQTYVGTALVSDYQLAYSTGTATARSRLVSVTRFANSAAASLPITPASLGYSDNSPAFGGKQEPWLYGAFSKADGWDGVNNPFTLADVNGDGFLDIVGFMNGVWVALGGQSKFMAAEQWIDDFSGTQGWNGTNSLRTVADVNGDGLGDVVGFDSAGVWTALSTGSSFVKSASAFPYFGSSQGWNPWNSPISTPVMLQDVNGDSIVDIVGMKAGTAWVALGQTTGTFATQAPWLEGFGETNYTYLMADFNGDGNADLLYLDSSRAAHVALSMGSATAGGFSPGGWQSPGFSGYCSPSAPSGSTTPLSIAEVNGDGLADIVAFCDAAYVTMSNGAGFQAAEKWNTTFAGPNWSVGNLRMLADLNGDGLGDLVGVTVSGVIAALSTGSSFADGVWNDNSLPWGLDSATRLMGDVNADGLMDMVGIGDATAVYAGIVTGPMPDLMTSATRSAGGQYAATYAPLSDPTVYSEANEPTNASQPALAQYQNFSPLPAPGAEVPGYRSAARLGGFYYVVKTFDATDNPAVGPTAYSYSHAMTYQNGLVDLNGRGWMGFATVTTNSGAAKQEVKTYRQDFPFTGQLTTSAVNDRSAPPCSGAPAPSSLESYTYGQVATPGTGTGSYSFVYRATTTRQLFQACASAHTVLTNYGYDPYGNQNYVAYDNVVDAQGNPIPPAHNLYVLTQYANDPSTWVPSYPLFRKTSASPNATNIGTFVPGTDVSLEAWTYDAKMNVASKGGWDDTNNQFLTEQYTQRDAFGNLLTTMKPSGAVYTTTYDSVYETYPVSRSVSPAAGTQLDWKYGYDPRFGLHTVATDPNGVTTNTCYDGFGRVSAMQSPYPANGASGSFDPACVSSLVAGAPAATNVVSVQQMGYATEAGLPALTTTYLNEWPTGASRQTFSSSQYFDGLWRKSKLVSTNPGATAVVLNQIGYTAHGEVSQSALPYDADSTPQFATVTHDVLRRPLQSTVPFGLAGMTTPAVQSTSYAATSAGVVATTTRAATTNYAETRQLTYGYAANKQRLISLAVGTGAPSTYTYDLTGRPLSIAAPPAEDRTTPTFSYIYDALGRTRVRNEPTRGAITFTYDKTGCLHQRQQAGGTFTYTCDLIGRRTMTADSDGRSRIFTYDGKLSSFGMGRLATASVLAQGGATESSKAYGYDANGNIASETLALASPKVAYPTTSAWDPQARLVQVTNYDNSVVQRVFGGSTLSAVTLDSAAGASFTNYTPGGAPGTITYQNGVTESWTYYVDGSPYQVSVQAPPSQSGAVLLSRQFGRDQLSRLLSIGDSSSQPVKPLRSLGYTDLRLTSASDTGGDSWGYGYDGAGNMTSFDGTTYSYSGTQVTSTKGAGGFTPAYNSMGDMTGLAPVGGNAFTYTYDARDQLVTATQQGDQTGSSYLYDAAGRRIAATLPDGSTTVYVSPWFMEVVAGSNATPTRVLSAFGRPFAQWGAGGSSPEYYLHTDHQHSVLLTTDTSGGTLAQFTYSPTGTLLTGPSGNLPRFLFTGAELDSYSGWYWLGNRYYNPAISRFNRPDNRLAAPPARQDAVNDNAYLLNSPATYFDPSGHAPTPTSVGCTLFSVASGIAGIVDSSSEPPNVNRAVSAVGLACTLYEIRQASAAARAAPGGGAPGADPAPAPAPPPPPAAVPAPAAGGAPADPAPAAARPAAPAARAAQDDDAANGELDDPAVNAQAARGAAPVQQALRGAAEDDEPEVAAANVPGDGAALSADAAAQPGISQVSLAGSASSSASAASSSSAIGAVENAGAAAASESTSAVSAASAGASAVGDASAAAAAAAEASSAVGAAMDLGTGLAFLVLL
jgi:RHS repeat-associated protein